MQRPRQRQRLRQRLSNHWHRNAAVQKLVSAHFFFVCHQCSRLWSPRIGNQIQCRASKHKRTPNDGRGVGLTLCYRVQLYHEYPYPGSPSLLGVSRVEYTLTYLICELVHHNIIMHTSYYEVRYVLQFQYSHGRHTTIVRT